MRSNLGCRSADDQGSLRLRDVGAVMRQIVSLCQFVDRLPLIRGEGWRKDDLLRINDRSIVLDGSKLASLGEFGDEFLHLAPVHQQRFWECESSEVRQMRRPSVKFSWDLRWWMWLWLSLPLPSKMRNLESKLSHCPTWGWNPIIVFDLFECNDECGWWKPTDGLSDKQSI